MWGERDFQDLRDQVRGVCVSVENLAREVRRDLHLVKAIYVPLVIAVFILGIVSTVAIWVATENRAFISSLIHETRQIERDVSQIEQNIPAPEPGGP